GRTGRIDQRHQLRPPAIRPVHRAVRFQRHGRPPGRPARPPARPRHRPGGHRRTGHPGLRRPGQRFSHPQRRSADPDPCHRPHPPPPPTPPPSEPLLQSSLGPAGPPATLLPLLRHLSAHLATVSGTEALLYSVHDDVLRWLATTLRADSQYLATLLATRNQIP